MAAENRCGQGVEGDLDDLFDTFEEDDDLLDTGFDDDRAQYEAEMEEWRKSRENLVQVVAKGIVAVCVSTVAAARMEQEPPVKKRRKRSCWVRNWIEDRPETGASTSLVPLLRDTDRTTYRKLIRMTDEDFQVLLAKVAPVIQKQDTVMREAIPAETRLQTTLHYLATGASYHTISLLFKMPSSTLAGVLQETTRAIIEQLRDDVIKMPSKPEDWKLIANQFWDRWQLPNCVGAIDGKHVTIKKPPKAESMYYNYKGTHSFVLFAVVDAFRQFLFVDVRHEGRVSDGAVIADSKFGLALKNGTLGLPPPHKLPGDGPEAPYYFIGDEAFALGPNLMRPYPMRQAGEKETIYNKRISRARSTVECAFGILSQRFRFMVGPIQTSVALARQSVMAACCLHNFLSMRHPAGRQSRHHVRRPTGEGAFIALQGSHARNAPQSIRALRDNLRDWLVNNPYEEKVDENIDGEEDEEELPEVSIEPPETL